MTTNRFKVAPEYLNQGICSVTFANGRRWLIANRLCSRQHQSRRLFLSIHQVMRSARLQMLPDRLENRFSRSDVSFKLSHDLLHRIEDLHAIVPEKCCQRSVAYRGRWSTLTVVGPHWQVARQPF